MADTATIKNLRIRVTSDTNSAVFSLDKLKNTILQIRNIAAKGLGLGATTSELSAFTASVSKIDTSGAAGQIRNLSNALTELSIATRAYGQSHAGGDSSMQAAATAEAFEEMRETVNEVNGRVEEMNKKLSSTKSETKKAASEANKLSEAFHSSGGAVSRLVTRIKNIALNRIIRSLLLSLRKGISEGLENFINYSEEAKSAMDQFATSSMYLKNSIAAALMPVLMQLIPVFQQIVGWIVKAVEAFSNFFAWTQGKSTYTAANPDFFVAWGEEADKTTKKTEKLKKTILGFDEINALSDNSSGSGSSSGKFSPNYNDMFIEKAVDVEKAKNFWWDVLDIVKKIGAAILAWKLSQALLSSLGQLSALQSLAKLALGAITVVLEFAFVYEGMKDFFDTGSTGGLIKAAIAAVLGTTILGITFGPGGVTVGIAVALVATIKAKIDSDWEKSELYKKLQDIKKDIEDTANFSAEIKLGIDSRNSQIGEILDKYSEARLLLDKIFELAGKETKSDGDLALLKTYVDDLNNLGLGTIIEDFDELTGSIGKTKQAAIEATEEIVNMMIKEAAASMYGEALLAVQKQKSNVAKAQNAVDEAGKALMTATGTNSIEEALAYIGNPAKNGMTNKFDLAGVYERWQKYSAMIETYSEALGNLNEAKGVLGEAEDQVNLLGAAIQDNAIVSINEFGIASVTAFSDVTTELKSTISTMTGEISLFADGSKTKIVNSAGETVGEIEGKVDEVKKYITQLNPELTISVELDTSELDRLSRSGIEGLNMFYKGVKVGTYATGGFPEDGLFFANSGELVGGFTNGRTAVANNEQIIAGIERGVENAMRSAGGMGGGDWTITIVDTEGNVRGSTVVTEAERVNRRSGTTVIPVGV